jgi:hypothetical protein
VARTVRHESIVIRKITIVITRPTSGSATGTPAATAAALTTTPASAPQMRQVLRVDEPPDRLVERDACTEPTG